MQATVRTFDATTRAGSVLLDDGTPLPFSAEAFGGSGLRLLRFGQRLNIRTEGSGDERRIVALTLATFSLTEH